MAFLRVKPPQGDDFDVVLGKATFSIGRSPVNDLHFQNPWLSRIHAQISTRDGGHWLADQGSRNGTYLNGRFLREEQLLRPGDRIGIGDIQLRYFDDDGGSLEVSDTSEPLAEGTVLLSSEELAVDRYRETVRGQETRPAAEDLLPALNAAAAALIVHMPLDELTDKVLELVLQAVPAERAALLLHQEGAGDELVIEATRGYGRGDSVSISRTIIDAVVENRQGVLTVDAQSDERFDQAQSILLQGIRSIICVPLWNNRNVIGMIYVDHRFTGHAFGESDLRLVGLIANMAAVKIENALLLAAQLEQERLEQQMVVAAQIQRKLLPDGDPVLGGYQIRGQNRSCFAIGGDYYDFVRKQDGKQAVVVADISGKGIGAALLMAALQASLRALVHRAENPAALVHELNQVLIDNSPHNKFATVFYAELDPERHVVEYVNGGHNPGLVVRANGTIEQLVPTGPIIGLIEEATFAAGTVELDPGDSLVLYTDGVTELVDADDSEFGEERLVALLEADPERDAEAVMVAIHAAMKEFSPDNPPADDCTLVTLHRLP